jgi:hypothetical protein
MTRWEDLTALEQAATIYSDAHKDAYGFRPRDGGLYNPITLADYEGAIEDCARVMAENEAEEAIRAAAALEAVWSEIADLQHDHGIDRETALRWWFEAQGRNDHSQAREHALWERGIAFRDFPEFGESAY